MADVVSQIVFLVGVIVVSLYAYIAATWIVKSVKREPGRPSFDSKYLGLILSFIVAYFSTPIIKNLLEKFTLESNLSTIAIYFISIWIGKQIVRSKGYLN